MAHPSTDWLLEPTIPGPPALPRLDRETCAANSLERHTTQYPSGTWRLGAHGEVEAAPEDEDFTDSQRFAKSDSEAPTVRPGALRALKKC